MLGRKKGWLGVVLLLFFVGTARAQIKVGLRFSHDKYLLYEAVHAELIVKNELGGPIILRPNGALFEVEVTMRSHRNNRIKRTEVPLISTLRSVDSLETVSLPINLLNTHYIRDPGTYHVRARITYRGQTFSSKKYYVDFSEGRVLEEFRTFDPARRFTLRGTHRDSQEVLLLRVDSLDNQQHYGTYPLGRLLRAFRPKVLLEAGGVVHVLHRLTPRQYMHSTFSAGGVPLGQKVVQSPGVEGPVFVREADGSVRVSGEESMDVGDVGDVGLGERPDAGLGERPDAGLDIDVDLDKAIRAR